MIASAEVKLFFISAERLIKILCFNQCSCLLLLWVREPYNIRRSLTHSSCLNYRLQELGSIVTVSENNGMSRQDVGLEGYQVYPVKIGRGKDVEIDQVDRKC